MKKIPSELTLGIFFASLILFATTAFATSGACSGHDGVDCSAGPDTDGSVICVDGWPDSSVSYSSMVKCEDHIFPSASPIPAVDTSKSFTDLSSSYKYRAAVEYMKESGIVEGYADGTYKPDNEINRAEFTKILVAYKFPQDPMSERNCFTDVADQWYAPYVCLAKAKGIIGGYPDGSFHPDQNITVPEALKIVLLTNGDTIPEASGDWYQKYLQYADSKGLRPTEWSTMTYSITRGEMAEAVWRLGK